MIASDRLLLEASSILRMSASNAARLAAAREVAAIDASELVTSSESRSHTLFAMRSTIIALAICADEQREQLLVALAALLHAARAIPPAHSKSETCAEPRRYWLEAG